MSCERKDMDSIKSYYGILISNTEKDFIFFNIFPKKDMEFYQNININEVDLEELSLKQSSYIGLKRNELSKFKDLVKLQSNRYGFKNQLYEIRIKEDDSSESYNSIFYDNMLSRDFINVNILSVVFLNQNTIKGREYRGVFHTDRFKKSINPKIEYELDKRINKIEYLIVYNVGQGNCIAACDNQRKPEIYFDVGGGYGNHSRTYPEDMKFNCDNNPLIVLSHWDGDHWVSAKKYEVLQTLTWIVPEQRLSQDAFKMAVFIHRKGRLLIYPSDVPNISHSKYNLIKCTGKTVNDSGLAMEIIFGEKNFERRALLPGDAKYKYIALTFSSYHYLIVSHHGAKDDSDLPKPANLNFHVYSYGVGNSYKHPNKCTVENHFENGWKTRLDTKKGSIILSTSINCNSPTNLEKFMWYSDYII